MSPETTITAGNLILLMIDLTGEEDCPSMAEDGMTLYDVPDNQIWLYKGRMIERANVTLEEDGTTKINLVVSDDGLWVSFNEKDVVTLQMLTTTTIFVDPNLQVRQYLTNDEILRIYRAHEQDMFSSILSEFESRGFIVSDYVDYAGLFDEVLSVGNIAENVVDDILDSVGPDEFGFWDPDDIGEL